MAMIAADFTGGEAEELRRAFGFKRSEQRMRAIEVKLRAGMDNEQPHWTRDLDEAMAKRPRPDAPVIPNRPKKLSNSEMLR